MIPVVSFVGRSESGKTTLLEIVIGKLRSRGYRVGVIKHSPHGFEIDHEGKDTRRFAKAGADVVAIASTDRIAFIEQAPETPDLDQIRPFFEGKVDIVFAEGFKGSSAPKILVVRDEDKAEPPHYNGATVAKVTSHLSPVGTPLFSDDMVNDIVNLTVQQIPKDLTPIPATLSSAR